MRKEVILMALIALSACTTTSYVTILNQYVPGVEVELAITSDERAQGLMNRTELDWNKGMVFFFEDEDLRHFWMKNTLIPLDIIFINADREIVTIRQATPCEEDPCPLYSSTEPAMYVLEVNQGWAEANHVAVGQKVELPRP